MVLTDNLGKRIPHHFQKVFVGTQDIAINIKLNARHRFTECCCYLLFIARFSITLPKLKSHVDTPIAR